MNNLEPVAFVEHSVCPLVSANNHTVELDCNTRRRQCKFINEIIQRRLVGKTPDLTIDLDAQFSLLPCSW